MKTTDVTSFTCDAETSAMNEPPFQAAAKSLHELIRDRRSCDFGTSPTSLEVDASPFLPESSRFFDFLAVELLFLNEFKEGKSTGDSQLLKCVAQS